MVNARKLAAIVGACALAAASHALAEPPRFTTFTFENDFFAGFDQHYTNGVQLAFLVDLDSAPDFIKAGSADPQAVVAIGQRMYTPANTDVNPPDPHDRPYAGWLYVMGDLRTRAGAVVDHLTVTAGTVGPASGAHQTQNAVHRLLGEDTSAGWGTQVRNKGTFMVGYERAWPEVAQTRLGAYQADVSLRVGATAGTPFTYADTGAVIRYGSNLPTDLPVTHISLGPPRDGFRGAPQFGWYGWLGLDGRAVAYNTFIQGDTFAGGPSVRRESFGTDVQVGVALVWPRARVGFTLVQRSDEFVGQTGPDRYGQLVVSFAY